MTKPVHNIAIALVHRDDRWLVGKRRSDAHLAGVWEFPGGKCAPGELPAQAAIRELREECAVAAVPERILEVVRCEYEDRFVHITPVVCRWLDGEPRAIGNESCGWVSAGGLLQLGMPAVNASIIRAALRLTPPI